MTNVGKILQYIGSIQDAANGETLTYLFNACDPLPGYSSIMEEVEDRFGNPFGFIMDSRAAYAYYNILSITDESIKKQVELDFIHLLEEDLVEASYNGKSITNQKAIYMLLEQIDSDNIELKLTQKGQEVAKDLRK